MRKLLPMALLLAVAVPDIASADKPQRPSMDLVLDEYAINLRDFTFPSGLRILFQEDHSQPIVSITAVVDRGASHDPLGREGIAHLIEHLWFRSLHGDLPKVWDVLDEFGANLNASTASDWTNYMTVAPKDALVPLLRLEALRIQEPIRGVTEENVLTEREVVRNELRMRYENTDGSALAYMRELLYPEGHPYHRLGIGTHGSLNNITLQDIQAFTEKNYRPEYTTIVVVGDFKVDDAWNYIQEAFPAELLVDPANPNAPLELKDPPVRVSQEIEEPPPPADITPHFYKGGVEKQTVVLAWSLPGGYRSNQPEMQITVNMLNFAIGSYLNPDFDPLVDDPDELSGFGCGYWPEEVNSTAYCFIEVGAGEDPVRIAEKAKDGLYQVWDINNRYWQQGVFARSRYSWMASIFQSVESVSNIGSGRATDTAEFVHFTGDPMYYSRMFEWLNLVDVNDGTRFAEKYLNRARAVTVILDPYEDEDITIDSSDAIYKGAVREAEVAAMIDLSEVDAKLLEGMMVPPNLSSVKEITLANGLNVVIMPYGSAPLVRAHMVFNGGGMTETRPGLAEFTMDNLRSDLSGQDFDPLRFAGSWEGSPSYTAWREGIVGSSANLEGLLFLLRNDLDAYYVDVQELKTSVKLAKKSLRRSRSKEVGWWESAVSDAYLFPGHPAGRVEDEAYYDAMLGYTVADAKGWLDKLMAPANSTLYIVGRVDPTKAEAAVRSYFEGWNTEHGAGQAMQLPAGPPEPPSGRRVVVLNDDRKSQTGATMRCQIGPATEANMEAREMLAAVLDEEAWLALREQSGVTYGAGSGQGGYPGGASVLTISSLVQNDGAGLATETFFRLSDMAARGELKNDSLTLQKVASARRYALGQQSTDQMMNRISWPFREGWTRITGRAQRLAAVTVKDLQGQMERCNGKEIVTLVGPSAVITPQLDKLGIKYEVLDWKAEADKLWEANDPKGFAKAKKKEAKAEAKQAKKDAKKAAKDGSAPPPFKDDEAPPSAIENEPLRIARRGELTDTL